MPFPISNFGHSGPVSLNLIIHVCLKVPGGGGKSSEPEVVPLIPKNYENLQWNYILPETLGGPVGYSAIGLWLSNIKAYSNKTSP